MNLASYTENGINYPTLICDTCGKPIKNAEEAIITFPELGGKPISWANGIYHKVKCDPGSQSHPYCDELSNYLSKLAYNLRIGRIVTTVTDRKLVIDIPEPDDVEEIFGRVNW